MPTLVQHSHAIWASVSFTGMSGGRAFHCTIVWGKIMCLSLDLREGVWTGSPGGATRLGKIELTWYCHHAVHNFEKHDKPSVCTTKGKRSPTQLLEHPGNTGCLSPVARYPPSRTSLDHLQFLSVSLGVRIPAAGAHYAPELVLLWPDKK